jgi:transcriptional regulator with XRE-family HTH domain
VSFFGFKQFVVEGNNVTMPLPSIDLTADAQLLSCAFKAIRRKRNLKTCEVAQRMSMPQRSYELFETGHGKITLARLMAFAEATDCDPFALLFTGLFAAPELAVCCADTKFAMILIISLQQFAHDRGRDIAYLEAPKIIAASQRLFKDLGATLDDNEAFLTSWLKQDQGALGMGKLSLHGVRGRQG